MVSPPARACARSSSLSYIAIAALSDCRLLAVWHRPAARPAFLVPPLTEDTAGIAAMDLSLAVVDMLGVPQPVVLLTIHRDARRSVVHHFQTKIGRSAKFHAPLVHARSPSLDFFNFLLSDTTVV